MKYFYSYLITSLTISLLFYGSISKEVSHYLFPDFSQGVILMRSGTKNTLSLNLNTLTEQMVFDNKGQKMAVAKKEMPLIDTIYIQDRKFVVLNEKFVESIHHSEWSLYTEYHSKLIEKNPSGYGSSSETSSSVSVTHMMGNGRLMELEIPDGYEIKSSSFYWLKKNGDLKKVSKMKDLKKLYPEKEDLFKKYIKKNKVKYGNQVSLIQLIDYMEAS
jgi:hypothetical protein